MKSWKLMGKLTNEWYKFHPKVKNHPLGSSPAYIQWKMADNDAKQWMTMEKSGGRWKCHLKKWERKGLDDFDIWNFMRDKWRKYIQIWIHQGIIYPLLNKLARETVSEGTQILIPCKVIAIHFLRASRIIWPTLARKFVALTIHYQKIEIYSPQIRLKNWEKKNENP